jgi:hypothetical protein
VFTTLLALLLLASPPPAISGEVVDERTRRGGRTDNTPLPFGLTLADFHRARK